MPAKLPYLVANGNISKALSAIKSVPKPEKVSQDFVKTKLQIGGSSGDKVTTFFKRIGFAEPNGSPTVLYDYARVNNTQGYAVAEGIKIAYAGLYELHEFPQNLDKEDLNSLIARATGEAETSDTVGRISSTFFALLAFADFEKEIESDKTANGLISEVSEAEPLASSPLIGDNQNSVVGLNLGTTIHLNLPESKDPEVFDAIFTSLKKHLL